MPVCVHCGSPVRTLYVTYGPSNIACTPCPAPDCVRSGRFADHYVEHDITTVVLDLILVKPSAYRHLLFNRAGLEIDTPADETPRKQRSGRSSSIKEWYNLAKRFVAFVLVDAYLRWFYLCAYEASPLATAPVTGVRPSEQVAAVQRTRVGPSTGLNVPDFSQTASTHSSAESYLKVVLATGFETLCLHVTVVLLCFLYVKCFDRIQERPHSAKESSTKRAVPSTEGASREKAPAATSSAIPPLQKAERRRDTPSSSQPAGPADVVSDEQIIGRRDFKPHLISTGLLLSSLSSLFLLCLVLLWDSKFPRSRPVSSVDVSSPPPVMETLSSNLAQSSSVWRWDWTPEWVSVDLDSSTDWAIRSVIGGLSAGVAMRVLMPFHNYSVPMNTFILLVGWSVAAWVRIEGLGMPGASGAGVRKWEAGKKAEVRYCLARYA